MILSQLKIVERDNNKENIGLNLSDIIVKNNIVKTIDYKKLDIEFSDIYFQDLTWK